jgi:hypothetical protein
MFFVICSLIIINNNDLKLASPGEFAKFSHLYSMWFDNFYLNMQNVSGYVVKMSWVPE